MKAQGIVKAMPATLYLAGALWLGCAGSAARAETNGETKVPGVRVTNPFADGDRTPTTSTLITDPADLAEEGRPQPQLESQLVASDPGATLTGVPLLMATASRRFAKLATPRSVAVPSPADDSIPILAGFSPEITVKALPVNAAATPSQPSVSSTEESSDFLASLPLHLGNVSDQRILTDIEQAEAKRSANLTTAVPKHGPENRLLSAVRRGD